MVFDFLYTVKFTVSLIIVPAKVFGDIIISLTGEINPVKISLPTKLTEKVFLS